MQSYAFAAYSPLAPGSIEASAALNVASSEYAIGDTPTTRAPSFLSNGAAEESGRRIASLTMYSGCTDAAPASIARMTAGPEALSASTTTTRGCTFPIAATAFAIELSVAENATVVSILVFRCRIARTAARSNGRPYASSR